MTSTSDPMEKAKDAVSEIPDDPVPWVVWLARCGYAAKGVVYIVIGFLAARVSIGMQGETTGPVGAMESIGRQPYGQILLILVAVGLYGYAIWRLVQAILDPAGEGTSLSGLIKRAAYAVSGITYMIFATAALISGADGRGLERWIGTIMQHPAGRWLIGFVALILAGTGLYQFYRAYTAKFREKMRLREISDHTERWITLLGRLGYAARGIVYMIIGWFLLLAAIQADPEEAVGVGQALSELANQSPYAWILGVVSVGLVLYGLFALAQSVYRWIYIPEQP